MWVSATRWYRGSTARYNVSYSTAVRCACSLSINALRKIMMMVKKDDDDDDDDGLTWTMTRYVETSPSASALPTSLVFARPRLCPFVSVLLVFVKTESVVQRSLVRRISV